MFFCAKSRDMGQVRREKDSGNYSPIKRAASRGERSREAGGGVPESSVAALSTRLDSGAGRCRRAVFQDVAAQDQVPRLTSREKGLDATVRLIIPIAAASENIVARVGRSDLFPPRCHMSLCFVSTPNRYFADSFARKRRVAAEDFLKEYPGRVGGGARTPTRLR